MLTKHQMNPQRQWYVDDVEYDHHLLGEKEAYSATTSNRHVQELEDQDDQDWTRRSDECPQYRSRWGGGGERSDQISTSKDSII